MTSLQLDDHSLLHHPATATEVAQLYQAVLGREPENAEVVQAVLDRGVSLLRLVTDLVGSDEHRAQVVSSIGAGSHPPQTDGQDIQAEDD